MNNPSPEIMNLTGSLHTQALKVKNILENHTKNVKKFAFSASGSIWLTKLLFEFVDPPKCDTMKSGTKTNITCILFSDQNSLRAKNLI